MPSTNDNPLKEVLNELIRKYRLSEKLDEERLLQAWEDVTGPMILKYTRDLYIKNKKLFVKLDSAALKNELSYAKTKLRDRLNDQVGKTVIEEIVFL